jgi:pimeloyl-ACP methyl ester carboxylesterase
MTSEPRHHYVEVDGRLVHYVTAGGGPPIVLVHASPGDWRGLQTLVDGLAPYGTVIAADTPGHGWSDPLPEPEPRIEDYGRALVRLLDALAPGPVHLYGTHTGAKIALSAAVARPDRVTSLVLDGLGVATSAERADQLAHYTPVHEPRPDGAHLVAAWHQVRDMFRFWPWYAQSAGSRLGGSEPEPEALHALVHGMLLAGPRYPLAYRAAFWHDPLADLFHVTVPTSVLAAPTDPLHAQLPRLGRLPPGVRIASDAGDLVRHVAGLVAGHRLGTARLRPHPTATPRRFLPTDAGDVHATVGAGDAGGEVRQLILAPLGAYACRAAAGTAVMELPGSGRSGLPDGHPPTVRSLATALSAACHAAGLHPSTVQGSGVAAAVARELARELDASLQVCGTPGPDPTAGLARLRPRDDGAHLLAAWHLIRDAAVRHLHARGRWPGASGEVADLPLIHARAVALAGSWRTLPAVYAACTVAPPVCVVPQRMSMWDPFADPGDPG